jgi:hypothetical protein
VAVGATGKVALGPWQGAFGAEPGSLGRVFSDSNGQVFSTLFGHALHPAALNPSLGGGAQEPWPTKTAIVIREERAVRRTNMVATRRQGKAGSKLGNRAANPAARGAANRRNRNIQQPAQRK